MDHHFKICHWNASVPIKTWIKFENDCEKGEKVRGRNSFQRNFSWRRQDYVNGKDKKNCMSSNIMTLDSDFLGWRNNNCWNSSILKKKLTQVSLPQNCKTFWSGKGGHMWERNSWGQQHMILLALVSWLISYLFYSPFFNIALRLGNLITVFIR